MTKRSVVIDTNVIISALLSAHGSPSKILRMAYELEIQPFYSIDILDEYADVISRPRFKVSTEKRNLLFRRIRETWILIAPATSTILMTDADDRAFFDTAVSSSSILITSNIKHFPTEPFIMSPANFLEMTQRDMNGEGL